MGHLVLPTFVTPSRLDVALPGGALRRTFAPPAWCRSDHGDRMLRPSCSMLSRGVPTMTASERQEMFNRVAPFYDNLLDFLSLGQHRVWKRMAISWSRAKPGDTVLDICCGSGDLSFLLAEKVGCDGKVTGLDFAEDQLLVASERQKAGPFACYGNMEWLHGDALNMPFRDETFDAVTVGYGLRNVVDIPKALGEICRVLKLGSTASILDFNRPTTHAIPVWLLDSVIVPGAEQCGLQEEYAYLKKSIADFPTGKEQERLAKAAGFSQAIHYEFAGGFMGTLVATR